MAPAAMAVKKATADDAEMDAAARLREAEQHWTDWNIPDDEEAVAPVQPQPQQPKKKKIPQPKDRPLVEDGGVTKRVLVHAETYHKPKEGDEAHFTYTIRLPDGTVLFSLEDGEETRIIGSGNYKKTPRAFALNDFHRKGQHSGVWNLAFIDNSAPRGLDIALKNLKGLERALFIFSPDYGYGDAGCPEKNVPPNATLHYEITMVTFRFHDALTDDKLVDLFRWTYNKDCWQHPSEHDQVVLQYRGITQNGKEFVKVDDYVCYLDNEKETSVFPEFLSAVRRLRMGEDGVLTISKEYTVGFDSIPQGETVVFELLLRQIIPVDIVSEKIRRKTLQKSDHFDAIDDDFVVTGFMIALDFDPFTVKVLGKTNDGKIILENDHLQFRVGDGTVPMGLDMSVLTMIKGYRYEVNVPAGLGWSPNECRERGIADDATFLFDVEVLDFVQAEQIWNLPFHERLEKAEKIREEGNSHFRRGLIPLAARRYQKCTRLIETKSELPPEDRSEAAKYGPFLTVCYSNLAACHLLLSEDMDALHFCDKALKLDSRNLKAIYRRAQALFNLRLLDEAKADVLRVVESDRSPNVLALEGKINAALKEHDRKVAKNYSKMFA